MNLFLLILILPSHSVLAMFAPKYYTPTFDCDRISHKLSAGHEYFPYFEGDIFSKTKLIHKINVTHRSKFCSNGKYFLEQVEPLSDGFSYFPYPDYNVTCLNSRSAVYEVFKYKPFNCDGYKCCYECEKVFVSFGCRCY